MVLVGATTASQGLGALTPSRIIIIVVLALAVFGYSRFVGRRMTDFDKRRREREERDAERARRLEEEDAKLPPIRRRPKQDPAAQRSQGEASDEPAPGGSADAVETAGESAPAGSPDPPAPKRATGDSAGAEQPPSGPTD